ncbi:uncharacterized protein LOC124413676 [Diprion similis]|uniref:uncharacterized protein LOC124413676 n=1 Tax=Diprion similis TaxID=362088 RepID=UPI001EF76D60|nr:uncharacterized protein LOC124413676 [Diprion similis]
MWWPYGALGFVCLLHFTTGEQPKIVIIGAGASGIAAASKLYEHGFQDVTILEAENRIGGRVYTTWFDESWVDLGGQWVHGETGNVAFELASPLGLLDVPEEKNWVEFDIRNSKGVQLPLDLSRDLFALYTNVSAKSKEALAGNNGSIADFFTTEFTRGLQQYPTLNETLVKEVLKMFEGLIIAEDSADNWNDISAIDYTAYKAYPGSYIVTWKDKGYGTILDVLMKKYPNPEEELPVMNNTFLNSEVVNINYNSTDKKILVETSNGQKYTADHVIATPSLGVLKEQYETLFTPQLPESKVKTIKGLSMGSAAKIYFSFEAPWWFEDRDLFLLWDEKDRQEYETDPSKKWMLDIVSFFSVANRPRILCAWINGAGARDMEASPENQVFNETFALLNKFFGNSYNITRPTGYLRTNWSNNKHFRGAYSFRSMESERSDAWANELAAPLLVDGKPIVMFAGEATNRQRWASVDGAIETGFREANRLMKLYNIKNPSKISTALKFSKNFELLQYSLYESYVCPGTTTLAVNSHFILIQFPAEALSNMEEFQLTLAAVNYLFDSDEHCIEKGKEQPKIVIIGAGASGIAAASKLYEHGFQDVTILEAENRIGGRVYTTWFDESWVDLGGQWVHGETGDVAFELASPLGLLEVRGDDNWVGFDIHTSKGVQLPLDLNITNPYDRVFKLRFSSELQKYPLLNKTLVKEVLKMFEGFIIWEDSADNWTDLAVTSLTEYHNYPGNNLINWKDRGYGTILDILMKKYPNPEEELPIMSNTLLNSEVVNINYNSIYKKVSIEISNGQKYTADHVIVTPSLGVLKEQYETLFTPQLPESKVKTIKGLSMGSGAKIYFSFEAPWWLKNRELVLLWDEKDRQEYENDPSKKWLLDLVGFFTVAHRPRILCAWINGAGARYMETLPESQVFDEAFALLNKFFGNSYNITRPTGNLRTNWSNNKHFRGTYSFRSIESERSDVWASELAAPLLVDGKPIVMFAGEATNSQHWASVDGAIETGFREANRLIKLYNIKNRIKFSLDLLKLNVQGATYIPCVYRLFTVLSVERKRLLHYILQSVAIIEMSWLYSALGFICLLHFATGEQPKIVIIGAGTSGIAAASKLYEHGFQDVTILEAENRIGGRVYTTWFDESWVDLGGQWVHGETGNVAFELASPLGLLEVPGDDNLVEYDIRNSKGVQLPLDLSRDLFALYTNVSEKAFTALTRNNVSLADFFTAEFTSELQKYPLLNATLVKEVLKMFEGLIISLDSSDNWTDLAVTGFVGYQDCPGSEIVNWKDRGYGTILDILMKKYPNPEEELPIMNNTLLNSEVVNINYNSTEKKVLIETSNGQKYTADHVIVTPSLGVLKEQYETLFTPQLPESKVKTIKGLSIGSVGKIYFSFEAPWWLKNRELVLLWDEKDRQEYENDPSKKWLLDLVGFFTVAHRPRILCAWINGAGARYMETLPESQVFDEAFALLNKFFGNSYNITRPTGNLRTEWSNNKHFRGTYSFRSIESDRSDVWASELAAPLLVDGKPIVMFAGEATNSQHWATVNGAIETGFREANRLIKLYNMKNPSQ